LEKCRKGGWGTVKRERRAKRPQERWERKRKGGKKGIGVGGGSGRTRKKEKEKGKVIRSTLKSGSNKNRRGGGEGGGETGGISLTLVA